METQLTSRQAVAKRMNDLLKERKITLYKFAQDVGILYDTLKKIKLSDSKSVSIDIVIQIASGFNMSLAQFVDDPVFNEDNLKL